MSLLLALEAKKGEAFTFSVGLLARTGTPQYQDTILQNSPTLAAGDVKVSKDNGTFNNLSNLPAVTPPASKLVQVQMTAAEMNADRVDVLFSDVAGSEWCDLLVMIRTTVRTIDDVLYAAYDLPDSVSVDGAQPTVQQALYELRQFLFERIVAGTTMSVKKPDGTTTMMTFTLNDAVNPTSLTRAT